jgi:DNA-binding PadR family transcriptional regulator
MWRRHFGPFEERRERVFEKGDFKYVVLDLLQEQPGYGYDLIRRLEERSGGRYAPSPGVLYPTLQLLEDMGCVVARADDGRKVYSITDEGRRFLAEQGERLDDIRERMHRWHGGHHGEHWRGALRDLKQFLDGRGGRDWDVDADKARRIGEVIGRARREIEAIIREPVTSTAPAGTTAGDAASTPPNGPTPPPRGPEMI